MTFPVAPKRHQSGAIGPLEVSSEITRCGGAVLTVNPDRDYGIDLFCAVRNRRERVLPYTFAVQVKAADTVVPKSGTTKIPVDQHEMYWVRNTTPVYGVSWHLKSRQGLVGDTMSIRSSDGSILADTNLQDSLQEIYFRTILSTHDRHLGAWYRFNRPFHDSVALSTWGRLGHTLDGYSAYGNTALSWWNIQTLSEILSMYIDHLDALDEIAQFTNLTSLRDGPLAPKYVAEALVIELFKTIAEVPLVSENCRIALSSATGLLNAVGKITRAINESSFGVDFSNWNAAENTATARESADYYKEVFERFYAASKRFDPSIIDYPGSYDFLFELMGDE